MFLRCVQTMDGKALALAGVQPGLLTPPRRRSRDPRLVVCTEVVAAVEDARRALVRLVRRDIAPAHVELDQLLDAVEDLASLAAAFRELTTSGGPSDDGAGAAQPRPGEYMRVAIESAVEAMRRGDGDAARRRAEIALWAARSTGSDDVVWLTTMLLELIVAPPPAAAVQRR